MNHRVIRIAAVAVLMGLAASGVRAATLNVRLVEASQSGPSTAPGLQDVAGLLARNTPYTHFALLSSRSMTLPGEGTLTMGTGVSVACSGSPKSLNILVRQGGSTVLKTTVKIDDQAPLILGGFPSRGGKLLLILRLGG